MTLAMNKRVKPRFLEHNAHFPDSRVSAPICNPLLRCSDFSPFEVLLSFVSPALRGFKNFNGVFYFNIIRASRSSLIA